MSNMDSTIVNDGINDKSSKNIDNNNWEFQAPHYFDFDQLNNDQQQPDNNDDYFLINHEYKNDDDDEIINDGDESIKENLSIDNLSLYRTPNVNNSVDEKYEKKYNFRETPLRSLYQNGNTPLRETGTTMKFGKRKSYIRNNSKTILKSNLTQDINHVNNNGGDNKDDDNLVVDHNGDDNGNEKRRETMDIKQIVDKLNEISIDNTNDNRIDNEIIKEEEGEENFHEITNDELSIDNNQYNDNQNQINNSKRQSYIVTTSPIVRFSIKNNNDDDDEKVIDKTPINQDENEKRRIKIKNRKATPMFGLCNSIVVDDANDSLNKSTNIVVDNNNNNNNRSTKYWKRFSQKLKQITNDIEKVEEDNKENDDNSNNKKNVVFDKAVDEVNKTTPIKKSTSTKISKSSINRLSSLPKRIQSEKKCNGGGYISLAEQTSRFLRSARQYQPKGIFHAKLTKPRPPRLLTELRSVNRRRIENEQRQRLVLMKKDVVATTTADTIDSTTNTTTTKTIKNKNVLPFVTKTKIPLTKAHTPVFCTEYRSKIYQLKHRNDNENDQQSSTNDNNKQFRARPMPNFKKIQARLAAANANKQKN